VSINWEAVESAGLLAAQEALGRGAVTIAARARELAPYRRVSEQQQASVVTRNKTAREVEEQRGIRERLGLGPETRASRIVIVRPPQIAPPSDTVTRRGKYEIKTQRAESGHLRDRIYASPATIEGRTITARVISPASYSKFLEFGTRNTPAHPFLRPAAHEGREALKADVAASVGSAIRSRLSGRIEAEIRMVVR
jgi:HK97 gp10 family phage protein